MYLGYDYLVFTGPKIPTNIFKKELKRKPNNK